MLNLSLLLPQYPLFPQNYLFLQHYLFSFVGVWACACVLSNAAIASPKAVPSFGHLPYAEASAEHLVLFQDVQIHKDIMPDLRAMLADAKRDGVALILRSGFRSVKRQNYLFYAIAKKRGQTLAQRAKVSAPPGYSEHHTGKAVDFDDGDAPTFLNVEFAQTKAGVWLQRNAEKYHFHLSFPKDNPQGVAYEPWHWLWRQPSVEVNEAP